MLVCAEPDWPRAAMWWLQLDTASMREASRLLQEHSRTQKRNPPLL